MFYKIKNRFKKISNFPIGTPFLYTLFLFSISILNSATITGKVIDKKSKEPLIGANIFIEADSEILGSATDMDGLYIIKDVPDG